MQPEVIDLLSSSDEAAAPRPKRRRLFFPPPPTPLADDDEIQLVSHVLRGTSLPQDLSQTTTSAPPGAEVAVVGARTGLRALVDYPHFRFQCQAVPFKRQRALKKEEFCPRCFCYVCDVPASECRTWRAHSKAVDTVHKWRAEREANLDDRRRRQAALPAARRTMPARHLRPAPVRAVIEDAGELSDVEEVDIGRGCEEEAAEIDAAFQVATRKLAEFELEENLFGMRPLGCALDETEGTFMPASLLCTASRRDVSRRTGAG